MNTRDDKALPTVTVSTCKMFDRAPDSIMQATELLEIVKNADWEKAEKIVKANSAIIFIHVSFAYQENNIESISPLKLAFKLLDTYMWKIFYNSIKDAPDHLRTFESQAREVDGHITIGPLFSAYDVYRQTYNQVTSDFADDAEIDLLLEKWIKVGEAQKKYLPHHMLKEFCREGNSWENNCFDVAVLPPPPLFPHL